MHKRIIASGLTAITLAGLTACGSTTASPPHQSGVSSTLDRVSLGGLTMPVPTGWKVIYTAPPLCGFTANRLYVWTTGRLELPVPCPYIQPARMGVEAVLSCYTGAIGHLYAPGPAGMTNDRILHPSPEQDVVQGTKAETVLSVSGMPKSMVAKVLASATATGNECPSR